MAQRGDLDQVLVDKIKGLHLEFKDKPQPELLIKLPNRHKDVKYEVSIRTSEFTSLCPLNMAQPDYARISIVYYPVGACCELKSLKFYLASFRNCPIFHEEVPALILIALKDLLEPSYISVTGVFTTRGGIDTEVNASYDAEEAEQERIDELARSMAKGYPSPQVK